jgi:hypothetical protein
MTQTPTRPLPVASTRPAEPLAVAAEGPTPKRRVARPSALAWCALIVAAVALLFAWRRLFLGIDLNDEGFYVAVPYRMALGARPFVDEMSILQTAALFVAPFVRLYVWLRGGAEGVVLFTRHLYLAWTVAISLAGCIGLKRVVRWEHALLAALVCTTFVFVSTTNLSYNTISAGFLVVGMALGARAVASGGSARWLAAAGVAQALAVFAYPTLVVALPVTAVCLAAALPSRRRRGLGAWLAGVGVTFAGEALLLLSFGAANVLRCARLQVTGWHTLNTTSGPDKLWGVVAGAIGHFQLHPLIVAAALVLWLAYRRWPVARLALALAPLALLPFGRQLVSGADGFGVVYGLAAVYFALFAPVERRAQVIRLLLWGYLPALAGGLLTGYTSTNGWLQMDVGLLPAMVLSGVFLALALTPRAGDGARLRAVLPGLALACLAGILAVTISYQFEFLPRAVPYSKLTTTIQGGPYAGVHTTPQRAAYLKQLTGDLARTTTPSDRVVFFYQVPAFSLFWPHRMATNTVWIVSAWGLWNMGKPGLLPPSTLAYYRREHTLPDVVVRLIDATKLSTKTLEQQYAGGLRYRLVLRRPQYAIFRRPADVTTLAQALSSSR